MSSVGHTILRNMEAVGTNWHDTFCLPCPAGYHSLESASSCVPCEMNQVSREGGDCESCPETHFAPAMGTGCIAKPKVQLLAVS